MIMEETVFDWPAVFSNTFGSFTALLWMVFIGLPFEVVDYTYDYIMQEDDDVTPEQYLWALH